jgi:predicted nucleotidyltransferase
MSIAKAKTEASDDLYLSQIRAILDQVLSDCKIYLFGSRVTDRYHDVSDFDIGVLASRNIDRELSLARELLEASNIPFTVDLVDLSTTAEEFARQVQKEGVLL